MTTNLIDLCERELGAVDGGISCVDEYVLAGMVFGSMLLGLGTGTAIGAELGYELGLASCPQQ